MVGLLRVLVLLWFLLSTCDAHGYLLVPPQRSSFWRERTGLPINYEDNQLNCGGYSTQWDLNGGKCGVCGDPYWGPWENQPPFGKYATGTISRCYKRGTTHIDLKMILTSNHLGTIQLRLCPHNDVSVPVTQDCLNTHLLQLENKNGLSLGTTYRVVKFEQVIELRVRLPLDIQCSQCVLQWTYAAGNNWGCDGPLCGMGHGSQEHFVNCADIAILNDCAAFYTTTTTAPTVTEKFSPTTWSPMSAVSIIPKDWVNCIAANEWLGQPKVDKWCRINCPMGYCPRTHCFCPDI
ncbi:uncharacterized protein LOC121389725 [Gigantopelta aegis]|uniref:uncharacterized protein LOC121389725 n=1 Tax=Gigantopelta aegis TaxID=1735272 RepID=UPI001B887CDB|nr:uncharacterized protein LOC121389725 [Gigantopelta aegis]